MLTAVIWYRTRIDKDPEMLIQHGHLNTTYKTALFFGPVYVI